MSLHNHGNIVKTTYWYTGNAVISNTYQTPVKTKYVMGTCVHIQSRTDEVDRLIITENASKDAEKLVEQNYDGSTGIPPCEKFEWGKYKRPSEVQGLLSREGSRSNDR
jgi:hypothetical protein